tara:strand:+ start:1441 stop:4191 length:2751 start_codon:yes stop_codon:yes gene_type:complete
MKKLSLIIWIILSINGLAVSAQTFFFQQNILSSSDDAEEKFDGSYVTTSSSDIEMMYDSWNSQGIQTIGLRFDNINIPANASIIDAYIQFTSDASTSGGLNITIKGEDIANSSTFVNSTNNISGRVTTSSSVLWNPLVWTNNQSTGNERTPGLTSIVSEIMTSNGWQTGNPITFILTGTGNSDDYRKADSFDESASQSAKLVVEYASNYNIDLALISCVSPNVSSYPDSAAIVKVNIINYGNLPASSYNVSYSINGNLIATEPGTLPLSLGQSVAFTFAQTANLSALGTYNFSAELSFLNDEDTLNNIITKPITVVNEIDTLFFNQGNYWRYWDSNVNPGNTWADLGFNDTLWPVGLSQFGFGEGDQQTVLNSGVLSYYFRKKVNVPNVNELSFLYMHMVHDDGAIIYINGQELTRSEMIPLGVVNHYTYARQSSNATNENNFYTYKVDSSYFVTGLNTIAVSVRNRSASDDDVSFDCYITPSFLYKQDGPYVSYEGDNIIVEEVTPAGLISNTYTSPIGLTLTCKLPHMGTSFSFNLKSSNTIEPSIYPSTPQKFLTISDFDGHIEGFTMILRREGIIDANFNWTYGNGHLIISGDLFDRGFHVTECMWLLYKLETEALAQGGKVHLILGNHEIFNMTDDWRYVEVKYFDNAQLMGKRMTELYDSKTELGRWLRSKNIIEKIGDYAFLHGGISPQVASLNLTYNQINDYGRMVINGTPCPNGDCLTVNGSDGIYWYRGMVDQILTQLQVDEFLDSLNVQRVIVGHTKDNSIRSLYNDRVMAIDMYHVDNFNNGYMKALQFELGCFYLFYTNNVNDTYTQLGDCDSFTTNLLELNGNNQLQIYPNPTANLLTVKLPTKLLGYYNYSVIDQTGVKVCQGKINSEITTIDVKRYSAGTYFLTIHNSQKTITGHFILKH